MNALHRDAGTAVTLALVGEAQGGLEVLLSGLDRAQELRGREGWAAELIECYGLAVHGFCSRYGLTVPRPFRATAGEPALRLVGSG